MSQLHIGDLPTPAGFAGATQFVRPEDVAGEKLDDQQLRDLIQYLREL